MHGHKSGVKHWRQSDDEQHDMKTIDNVYKYDYDTAILKFPSIAGLLSRDEFYKFQAQYNNK